MIPSPRSGLRRRLLLVALPLLAALGGVFTLPQARAQALFGAQDVDQQRFLLVAAPIGSKGDRYQLNIYEQVTDRRPCFAAADTLPSPVNPLLATFDFTGICGRYIDANGYSLRVGGSDLATSYRLMVRNASTGSLLVALPTKAGAGPEMVVARSGGPIDGFHKLQLEPGWMLMRRTYGGRRLGHLYVYSASWPGAEIVGTQPAAAPATAPATAPTTTPSLLPPSQAGSPSPAAPDAAAAPATPSGAAAAGPLAPPPSL